MSRASKLLFAIAVAAIGVMRPTATLAQGFAAQRIVLSANVFEQGITETNAVTAVTKAPPRSAMTTESLLKQLATDEFASTNWSSNSFPDGAKLNFSPNSGFSVVDKNDKQLMNVANLLYLQAQGTVSLSSGNAQKGPLTEVQLINLVYDATAVGGTASFNVTALASFTGWMTKPDAAGNYLESNSLVLHDGIGEGTNAEGRSIIITGFILTASGAQSLNTSTAPSDQAAIMSVQKQALGAGGPPLPPGSQGGGPPPPEE
jgi:hypothetical protein